MKKLSIIVFLLFVPTLFAQPPAPNPCENPEAKSFDWQIGVWQSEDGKQTHEIRKIMATCIIQETWKTDGRENAIGIKSLDNGNHNQTGEKKWFYSWIAQGFHQLWEGRREPDGQWRFYREWYLNGEKILSRTYWTPTAPDKLERIVEQSRDNGKTWKPHVKNLFIRKTAADVSAISKLKHKERDN